MEVRVKLKGGSYLPVTFKVKFMFELALLHIIFNMATSNNKMGIYISYINEAPRYRCVK